MGGLVGRGWWKVTVWQQKHKLRSYTCIMDPLLVEIAQKVVKSVDNITARPCESLKLGSLCLTASIGKYVTTNWAFMDVLLA